MTEKAKVHALPIEKAVIAPIGTAFITMLYKDNTRQQNWCYDRFFDGMEIPNAHHLYFTTDEEIKEGGWIFENSLSNESIHQVHSRDERLCFFRFKNVPIWLNNSVNSARKIVATTDPDLWGNPEGKCRGSLDMLSGDGEDGEGMADPFYMRCRKCGEIDFYNEKSAAKGCHITSEKNVVPGIPRISTDFIEAYVKEQGAIKEVLLEVETDIITEPTVIDDNPASKCLGIEKKLKLRSNGTCIIHPVKQKMYTRAEVLSIINRSRLGYQGTGS